MASHEAQKAEAPFAYKELLQNGKTQTFRRMLLGVFINAAQQLSGINMVSTYANQILGTSFDLSPGMSHLIAACGGTEYALCSLLSVLLIEGLGRRKAFMWTATGMAACFVVIPLLLTDRASPEWSRARKCLEDESANPDFWSRSFHSIPSAGKMRKRPQIL